MKFKVYKNRIFLKKKEKNELGSLLLLVRVGEVRERSL